MMVPAAIDISHLSKCMQAATSACAPAAAVTTGPTSAPVV